MLNLKIKKSGHKTVRKAETVTRPNLIIIGTEKEETCIKCTENILNTNIGQILKKLCLYMVQKHTEQQTHVNPIGKE